MTLNERGGASRQQVWKVVNAKFPEADYKIFLVRLKKYSSTDGFVVKSKNGARYKIDSNFRNAVTRRVARGMTVA